MFKIVLSRVYYVSPDGIDNACVANIYTNYQIISVVVEAASEGEVNEGISHETLTGAPIMREAVADKEGGKTHPICEA
ncbi:hypothetical protein NQZ68_016139 [Dissostichus eleginoides]|nr:hypothetical protein NQZ68_016139 [Dissostichus eleginoides]